MECVKETYTKKSSQKSDHFFSKKPNKMSHSCWKYHSWSQISELQGVPQMLTNLCSTIYIQMVNIHGTPCIQFKGRRPKNWPTFLTKFFKWYQTEARKSVMNPKIKKFSPAGASSLGWPKKNESEASPELVWTNMPMGMRSPHANLGDSLSSHKSAHGRQRFLPPLHKSKFWKILFCPKMKFYYA